MRVSFLSFSTYIVMMSFIEPESLNIAAKDFYQCSETLLVVYLFDQVGAWPGEGPPPLTSLQEICGGFRELVVVTPCGMACDPWHKH